MTNIIASLLNESKIFTGQKIPLVCIFGIAKKNVFEKCFALWTFIVILSMLVLITVHTHTYCLLRELLFEWHTFDIGYRHSRKIPYTMTMLRVNIKKHSSKVFIAGKLNHLHLYRGYSIFSIFLIFLCDSTNEIKTRSICDDKSNEFKGISYDFDMISITHTWYWYSQWLF